MALSGISRELVFANQQSLDELVGALQDVRGRMSSAQETRIMDLMSALIHGNAPASGRQGCPGSGKLERQEEPGS